MKICYHDKASATTQSSNEIYFRIKTVYAMTKSIRTVLTPLLIVSYVLGTRITEFPAGHPRVWFSLSYMLLLWSTYCFLLNSTVISYFTNIHFASEYLVCYWLDMLLTILSVGFGIYHDKVCMIKNC